MAVLTQFVRFDQPRLSRWFGQIDATDAVILRYIEGFQESKGAKHHPKDDTFVWIHLPSLLESLPILNIGYDALRKRISKLRKLGILQRLWGYHANGQRMLYLKVCIKESQERSRHKSLSNLR